MCIATRLKMVPIGDRTGLAGNPETRRLGHQQMPSQDFHPSHCYLSQPWSTSAIDLRTFACIRARIKIRTCMNRKREEQKKKDWTTRSHEQLATERKEISLLLREGHPQLALLTRLRLVFLVNLWISSKPVKVYVQHRLYSMHRRIKNLFSNQHVKMLSVCSIGNNPIPSLFELILNSRHQGLDQSSILVIMQCRGVWSSQCWVLNWKCCPTQCHYSVLSKLACQVYASHALAWFYPLWAALFFFVLKWKGLSFPWHLCWRCQTFR